MLLFYLFAGYTERDFCGYDQHARHQETSEAN